jgi:hypothetical protein
MAGICPVSVPWRLPGCRTGGDSAELCGLVALAIQLGTDRWRFTVPRLLPLGNVSGGCPLPSDQTLSAFTVPRVGGPFVPGVVSAGDSHR